MRAWVPLMLMSSYTIFCQMRSSYETVASEHTCWRMEIEKVAVLPVPDWAWAITS